MPNPYVDGIQNGSTTIDIYDKELRESLGTASTYDVPESGDASDNEVVKGDDTRLGNIKGNNTVLTTDKTPFLTRQTLNPTGFSGYVREKLIGASYAWNQLVQNGNFASTSNWGATSSATFTVSGNKATVTKTGATSYVEFSSTGISGVEGHKYLFRAKVTSSNQVNIVPTGSASGGGIQCYNNGTYTYWIWSATSASFSFRFRIIGASYPIDLQAVFENCSITDLTLAFGSTIADYLYGLSNNGGITKLRDMGFPIDKYTPYGYGLYSVKTSGKKINGFNLCMDFDNHTAINSSGIKYTNEVCMLAKEKIKIYSNFIYYSYLKYAPFSNPLVYVHKYRSNGSYLGYNQISANGSVTFDSDVGYIYIQINKSGGNITEDITTTQYNFNVSDVNKNGQYEPYCGYEISLGNDELRGKFDLVNGEIVASGDVKESNGNIDRNYQRFNLGDYNWQESEDGAYYVDGVTLIKGSGNNGIAANMMCANYVVVPYSIIVNSSTRTNKTIALQGNGTRLFVYDTAYSDPTTFKTAMNGVYLDAELATPTTEQSTPFADPMSMVGATTEEYIDTRDIPCPVGAERQYMGESNDVIPIPSSPMSNGKRVLTSYKSGDKEQLVWEDVDRNIFGEMKYVGYLTPSAYLTWEEINIDIEEVKNYKFIVFGVSPNSGRFIQVSTVPVSLLLNMPNISFDTAYSSSIEARIKYTSNKLYMYLTESGWNLQLALMR